MTELAETWTRRYEPVPDELVLAAIDRADRHSRSARRELGVSWQQLVSHLGFVHNSWTTRNLRPQVDALIADRLVTKSKAHSRLWWKLTEAGRRRVAQARRAGEPALPPSPQRRLWREYQSLAREEIGRVREDVGRELDDALRLLNEGKGDSEVWRSIGKSLAVECSRLASAVFCLNEWAEPDDENPDRDNRSPLNLAVSAATRDLTGGRDQ
jgi:hypothetical protein